jgi:stage V sporulation protein K
MRSLDIFIEELRCIVPTGMICEFKGSDIYDVMYNGILFYFLVEFVRMRYLEYDKMANIFVGYILTIERIQKTNGFNFKNMRYEFTNDELIPKKKFNEDYLTEDGALITLLSLLNISNIMEENGRLCNVIDLLIPIMYTFAVHCFVKIEKKFEKKSTNKLLEITAEKFSEFMKNNRKKIIKYENMNILLDEKVKDICANKEDYDLFFTANKTIVDIIPFIFMTEEKLLHMFRIEEILSIIFDYPNSSNMTIVETMDGIGYNILFTVLIYIKVLRCIRKKGGKNGDYIDEICKILNIISRKYDDNNCEIIWEKNDSGIDGDMKYILEKNINPFLENRKDIVQILTNIKVGNREYYCSKFINIMSEILVMDEDEGDKLWGSSGGEQISGINLMEMLDSIVKKSKEKRYDIMLNSLDVMENKGHSCEIQSAKKKEISKEEHGLCVGECDCSEDESKLRKFPNFENNLITLNGLIELGKCFNCKIRTNYKGINLKIIAGMIKELINLSEMEGLVNIKQNIVDNLLYFMKNGKEVLDRNLLNIAIYGPPGVGKTTLAGHIAKLYRKVGILNNDKIIKAKRSDLIGQYLGETSLKTQKVIDNIEGGILLIDEVYSLGHSEGRDSYSKECLDVLTHNLGEKPTKFICIVAGYEEDIEECFFSINRGLKRRFPFVYRIDKCNTPIITKFTVNLLKKKGWKIEENGEKILREFIEKNNSNFSCNMGDAENIVLKLEIKSHSENILTNGEKIINKEIIRSVFGDDDSEIVNNDWKLMYI